MSDKSNHPSVNLNNSPCNICGSQAVDLIRAHGAGELRYDVVRCQQCSLLFVSPMPAPSTVLEQYSENYFLSSTPLEGGYENYSEDEPSIKKTFLHRFNNFPAMLRSKPGSVLDIGCATGLFLDLMRDKKWQTTGVDVSSYAADIARSKGHAIVNKELISAKLPAESFDLIVLWDVIEHFVDPCSVLIECRRLLKPSGFLMMTTPDAGAWFAKITGRYWLGFRCAGEHIYFFDRSTMTKLLQNAGFKAEKFTAVGKWLRIDRLMTRAYYYTRLFRPFSFFIKWLPRKMDVYVNSADTMWVVASKDTGSILH